jgi:hypothetical protein
VIDTEGDHVRQAQARDASKQAKEHGVRTAISKPCFELWLLLHLEDTGEYFQDCSAVFSRFRATWKTAFGISIDRKRDIDHGKLISRIPDAIERATKHIKDPSHTEVYKVIEYVGSVAVP